MNVIHAFFGRYGDAIVRSTSIITVATISCLFLGEGKIIAAGPSQVAGTNEQTSVRVAQRTSTKFDFSKIEAVPIFDGKTLEGW